MAKIVVTSELPGRALAELGREHEPIVLSPDGRVEAPELARALADADALLCLLTNPITNELLQQAPRLRVIGNCAVGYDNIDVAAARARGIVVVNTPNVLTEATADFAWALLLGAARRVVEADRFVRAGRFRGWELGLFVGADIHEKTLGVIGFGRIGRAVARRAAGFSMRVLYTQRTRAKDELGARFVPLAELLAESDFVSIHVPLTNATRHLIDAQALSRMKPSAVLINTARGPIVDERALAEALASEKLAAAGLDVFEREPEVEARLLELDRAVLAPHIASATEATRSAMALSVTQDILRVLRGEPPVSEVRL